MPNGYGVRDEARASAGGKPNISIEMSVERTHPSLSRSIVEPSVRLAKSLASAGMGKNGRAEGFFDAARSVASRARRVSLPPLAPDPKVSCVMVSRNRLEWVRRSIDCYLAQTYAHRELVIVRDPSVPIGDVEAYVASLRRDDIRLVRPDGPLRLNELRNLSFARASGELFCQWDDDDLSHPDRVRIQAEVLLEHDVIASLLQDEFEYFVDSGELYWANWESTPLACLPGTLMVRRDAGANYPMESSFSERSEDSAVLFGLAQPVAIVGGAPYLYVYSFHGDNTWGESHRRALVQHLVVSSEGREEEFVRELARVGLRVEARSERNGAELGVASSGLEAAGTPFRSQDGGVDAARAEGGAAGDGVATRS
jgi:hypothetical protein